MKVKYIVYTVLVLGGAALIGYRITENKKKDGPRKEMGNKKPTRVTGIVLQPQVFADNLSLTGSLEPNEQVDVRSEVSGVVRDIRFSEGGDVQKGQVLFKVDDTELRARLAQAKSAEALAAENARRARLLLEKEAISQEEFDVSNADYQSAKAQSQLIRAQLAKTVVRAPFSGRIGLRYISTGTYVTPETPVAKLVNNSQLKLTFSIPEKYAAQMKAGSPLTFGVAGSRDRYTAKIYAIEPEVEATTRTLKMRAVADNRSGRLIPGTFANVELPLARIDDALLVPSEALIPIQNGKKVFVSRNGKAMEIVVETGSRTDRDVLILSGLKAGDTVLTSGVMSLKNEDPVTIAIAGAPSSPKK
ncbi:MULTISPECIES: efflux RND transporter periplasmic adaptor subunit [unclassified Flavobacterium]|uniref:efflux RND transporter periplasmic adaptor subunit n=1 Tax=unclassified Flavobacterium TaxID=196869 RepID=UPI001F1494A4|nr:MULTISPECIES: efflux RND transporter periplasmic adaptor subunit [unclassified Flavobacterium]UMY64713.1 efflux RND transporter periplasmic adaptor subunit [Flavobacterium sp. HJ-32-4]